MSESAHQKTANRKIKQWIENERRIVTYREVSREVGCSVSEGKNILLSYLSSNPSSYPTYLLTGPLRSQATLAQTQLPTDRPTLDAKSLAALAGTQRVRIVDMDEVSDGERNSEDGINDDEMEMGNDEGAADGIAGDGVLRGVPLGEEDRAVITPEEVVRRGVVLVGMEGLEEKMELFEPGECHVHIYSLSAARVKDPAQYLISALNLRSAPTYTDAEKYHTITGDAFAPAAKPTAGGATMKDGGMDFGKPTKAAKDAKGAGKEEVKPAKPTTTTKEERQPATTKKEAVAKEPPTAAPAPSSKKLGTTSSAPSAPSGATAARVASSSKKKRVITSDDEEDETTREGLEPPAAADDAPSSSMVRAADDRAAMEAMMGMGMDVDDVDMDGDDNHVAPPAKGEGKTNARKSDTASGNTGRKKRKVKKTETTMDEKGYMVTKDVYVEESGSGSEGDEPPPLVKKGGDKQADLRQSSLSLAAESAKPRPPANKPGTAPPGKGQSTLAGFFKRK